VKLSGVAASPGTALAPALVVAAADPQLPDGPVDDPQAEAGRLQAALDEVSAALQAQSDAGAGEAAEILAAQATMVADPELRDAAVGLIRDQRLPAARAVVTAGEPYAEALSGSDSPYLAARAADVRDVCRRTARRLLGLADPDLGGLRHPVVVVADDLAPADTARMDPALVVGLVTSGGSRTSHTAILARSLGVPAVVAVEGLLAAVGAESLVGVDGDAGEVVVDPPPDEATTWRRRADAVAAKRERAGAAPREPGATADGHRVELAANVGTKIELRAALAAGAEGVGLLRTELAYLDRSTPPDEAEQAGALCELVALLDGRRLVVRTFDFGADKPVPFLDVPGGPNPALGVRGIRLAQRHPDLLDTQLRAVVRAAAGGPVAVMAPMVATLAEAEWFVERVTAAGGDDAGVEVGVMVEVPSAVLIAQALARELAFLSIGTNDLTQYLHAADRQEGALAGLQDPFSPAVLAAVVTVARAGEAHGAWVGVCGEAAGDPEWALLAVGLGVRELSMGAASLDGVRAALAGRDLQACRQAAERALAASDADAARAALSSGS